MPCAQAQVAKQRVALAKAELAAGRAREGIELLTLKAPRDGILLVSDNDEEGRPFESGDTTWPGRVIARLPELSSMIVEAGLFDVDDGKVYPGLPVVATIDAFPSIDLEGVVVAVEDIASETSRQSLRRMFRTRIELEGLDLVRMRPGMSVRVTAEERRQDVLLIPRAALGWSAGGASPGVVAGLDDGTVAAVQIGACNTEVCVLEDGLGAGQRLSELGSSAEMAGAGSH